MTAVAQPQTVETANKMNFAVTAVVKPQCVKNRTENQPCSDSCGAAIRCKKKKKLARNHLAVTAVVEPQSVKNMPQINSVVTHGSFKNWK